MITVGALILAVILSISANELHAHGTWLARKVITTASLLLPTRLRSTMTEEWLRHVDDIGAEGRHGAALIWSLGAFTTGIRLSEPISALRARMGRRRERRRYFSDRENQFLFYPAVDSCFWYERLGLNDVVIEGGCRLHNPGSDYFGNGDGWTSPILESPTVAEIMATVAQSIAATEDFQHRFLESLHEMGRDDQGVPVYGMGLGS